jgi:hypothetical protein
MHAFEVAGLDRRDRGEGNRGGVDREEQVTMRAILIDPEKRTITETQLSSDDFRKIQAVLRCHSFTTGAHLSGSIEKGFDAIYVSDDYLEERDDPRFWFQVDADRNPPSSYPIAGLGLALGTDTDGAGCDVRISVAELASRITFTQRKFRGFEVSEGRGRLGDAPVYEMVNVGLKAPIIDGTAEGSTPTRPGSWNAKMVLSGEPLITDEQFERLLANAPTSLEQMRNHDPVPVVKIFLPHIRWILGWVYPDDRDRAYAVVQRGNNKPEAGDVLLSDIVRTRLGTGAFGIAPERDKYITLDKPLSQYLQNGSDW